MNKPRRRRKDGLSYTYEASSSPVRAGQTADRLHSSRSGLVKAATTTSIARSSIDVYLRAQQQPDALHGSFAYYRALDETIRQNRERASTRLTLPVLAIGGAASRGDAVGSDLRRVADDVTSVTIPDCGHYVPEEAPEALLGELRSFLVA